MFRSRHFVVIGALGAAVLIGCSVNVEDPNDGDGTSGGGSGSANGTVEVSTTRASALVTGTFEGDIALEGSFELTIGGKARTVVMSPDRTFVIRDVPQGDVEVSCGVAGARGTLTLPDVKAGEHLFLSVRLDGLSISIQITSREAASEPPREVTEPKGEALVIAANNVCYFLKPGVYERDIEIRGNHVSLVGAEGCGDGQRSVLKGELRVKGNHAMIHDVDLSGSVVVEGNAVRIQDSCSKCWSNACYGPGKSGNAGGCDNGGSTCQDAGTPPADSGAPTDAGPVDSGATDAGEADAMP